MTRNHLIALLIICPLLSHAQSATHKVTLLNGKVELTVPDQFQPMSDQLLQNRFRHSTGRPQLALIDSSNALTLVGQETQMPAKDDDMAAIALYQYQDLKKRQPDAQFPPHPHGTIVVNGKKIAWLKFIHKAVDTKSFEYFFFLPVDGKILALTLGGRASDETKIEPLAEKIIQTLKIK